MIDGSILGQVKRDATEAADERWRAHIAQLEMLGDGDAFERGRISVWDDQPSRFRWWLFGVACGAAAMWGVMI